MVTLRECVLECACVREFWRLVSVRLPLFLGKGIDLHIVGPRQLLTYNSDGEACVIRRSAKLINH